MPQQPVPQQPVPQQGSTGQNLVPGMVPIPGTQVGPWTPQPGTEMPKPPGGTGPAPVPPGAVFLGPPGEGVYGVPGVPASQATLPPGAQLVSVDGAIYVLLNGTLFQYAPQVSAAFAAGVQLSPFGGVVAGKLGVGVGGVPAPCPPGAVAGDDGVCRLKGYAKVPGAVQAIPNAAGILVDFARPETYRNANLTPGVLATGLWAVAAGVLGATVGR